jgi:tetratricopeptide (TPR) repeat protein
MAMRANAIGTQFGGEQKELMNNPYLKLVANQYIPFEFSEKLATIFYTLGKYIQLLFVPYPLTHDYYPRHIDIMNFSNWRVLLSIAVYGALIWFLLRGWQKRELISFGIAYFLITLSIVSNIVFPVGTNMAERFMFMPSIGFALVLAIILSKILRGGTHLYGAGIIVLLFSVQTIMRNFAWKDNFTIFTTDVKTSINSAKLQCSAGGAMIEKYAHDKDLTLKKAKFEEAIAHLKRALEIHPPFKNPYLLLGNAYFYLEDWNNAIPAYESALNLDANFKDAKSNLALAYRQAGKHQGQVLNNINGAIDLFTKSLEINPNDGETWSNLGTCYGINNQPLKLIEALNKALALRPSQSDAANIGIAYRQIGDTAKAIEWEQKAANMK